MVMGNIKYCKNHPNKRAVNMRHELCHECNFIRTHGGKTMREHAIEKQREYIQRQKNKVSNVKKERPKIERKSAPIKISAKQKVINSDLSNVYKEIDNEREQMCTGCSMYQGGDIRLSHSHIISQADCKRIGMPELIVDKENITFHCVDFGAHVGCHRIHETKRYSIMKQLHDCEKNLAYIESKSKELYNRIVNK